MAPLARLSKNPKSQSSATARIGLEPTNSEASTARPARCDTSTIADTSSSSVRPAHTGRICQRLRAISRHISSASAKARVEALGKPTFTYSMPSAFISSIPASFWSNVGFVTDGLCSPSRSVSSRSVTLGALAFASSAAFQSKISELAGSTGGPSFTELQ